jgi:conjugal transfer pilus assembly protein TraD
VPVLFALLLIPAAWATGIVAAALVGSAALALARAAYRRRAAARAERAGEAGAGHDGGAIHVGAEQSGRPVVLSEQQLSAHGLILGASGSGKTTTLMRILTEHVLHGRPVVMIDMKGSPEVRRQLEAAAAAAGRPFRVWTPDGPGSWNPLQHGNATELKDKLIATERFTEPHYQRAAERYVQSVLQVLRDSHPGRAATLHDVVDLMDPRRLAATLRDLPRERAERVQDYLAALTPDQLSAIKGLATRLAIITESDTGAYLGAGRPDPSVDVRRALSGGEVVLFSLNSSRYGKLAAQLGSLAIQDLVAATGHRLSAGGGQQAIVGIDEFSALDAGNVVSLLARGRESGISAFVATQELADLDRAGAGLRDQVLGVTAIKIIHRQDVPASAHTVAQMAGTEQVWERTYQIAPGLLGQYGRSRGTRRQVEQFVVHPNLIKSLPTGRAVVLTKIPTARVRIVDMAPCRVQPAADAPRVADSAGTAPGPTDAGRAGGVAHGPQRGVARGPQRGRGSRAPSPSRSPARPNCELER